MEPSNRAVRPLRQRIMQDMRLCKQAPMTQSAYIRSVRRLAGFIWRSPETVNAEDLHRIQLQMFDSGASRHHALTRVTGAVHLW